LANQREDRARNYAGQVYGIGQNNATQAMNMYGNPLMAQMNSLSPTALLGTAGQFSQALGPKLFQPESQYMAGIYGANQSNNTQTQLGNQQAQAGLGSGLMSLAGNLGGAYLKNENLVGGNNFNQNSYNTAMNQTFTVPNYSNALK
jgi:hypothetical protein